MSIPGLIDKNVLEVDEQYRKAENLVSVDDIEKLMKIYNIGKGPLSLALGFGEITIPRYLEGQVPSREYSDVIRAALTSSGYMKKKLRENHDKLTDTAYRKAMTAADSIESEFSVSEKMLGAIDYLFDRLEEITPLMLQQLLYFVQGVYSALYGRPFFEEDCRASAQGPVYPEVYEMFRDFKYNPVDDARFALVAGSSYILTDKEKNVIDLVVDTFGIYGGRTMEHITRRETPWKDAWDGDDSSISSGEPLSKDRIMRYYRAINRQYGIGTEKGIKKYIHHMLDAVQ